MNRLTGTELARLATIDIELDLVEIPAFHEERGYWSDYDRLALAGIDRVAVRPRLYGMRTGSSVHLRLDAILADASFQDLYGLVYGDDGFEAALAAHVTEVLGVSCDGAIGYTEQGQQATEFVSMEGSDALAARLAGLSNHALLALSRDPRVRRLEIDGRVLPTRKTDR